MAKVAKKVAKATKAARKVLKRIPAKRAPATNQAPATKRPHEPRASAVPQRKGTYRVRLRLPAVEALGLTDEDKASSGGLTVVARQGGRTITYEGSATAMKTLLKDAEAIVAADGAAAGSKWAVKTAVGRVEAALAAGAHAGGDEPAPAANPKKTARKASAAQAVAPAAE